MWSRKYYIGYREGGNLRCEYLGVDPTVIRLLAVILGFTGSGVLAYIVAAILIPENPVY